MMTIEEYTEELSNGQRDGMVINLLLTLQCNLACDRCFYFSSPRMPNRWMSHETLSALENGIRELNEIDVYPTINLVGGEPTLNMKQFERVLEQVSSWYDAGIICGIEMTTNGWWLVNQKHTREFFRVVARHAPGFGIDDGFSVRISSSEYHDLYRNKEWMKGEGALDRRLRTVWENYYDEEGFQIFYEEEMVCIECGELWEEVEVDEEDHPMDGEWACKECRSSTEYEYQYGYEWPYRTVPNPHEDGNSWIYVDEQRTQKCTTASGKASVVTGGEDVGARGGCRTEVLTFKPDGTLGDVCCMGSELPIGNTRSDLTWLMYQAYRFQKQEEPSCYSCNQQARDWMRENDLELFKPEVDFLIQFIGGE